MSKPIKSITELDSVRNYLNRIGAEPRSLLVAVVKEVSGKYWRDVAVIRFSREGVVECSLQAYVPTEKEEAAIAEDFAKATLPKPMKVSALVNLPEPLASAAPENIFEFRDEAGDIIMLQLRRDSEDGGKSYVPWTYWDDGEWHMAEPEGPLPLWGTEQLKEHSVVFVHEGAKAARAMRDLTNPKTPEGKKKLAEHPWGEELSNAAHLGWIGGALSPARTDWSVISRSGASRVYIVSDNDEPGVSAVAPISMRLRATTFHVQFTDDWPVSFDLADNFPDSMFSEVDGTRYYTGPSFHSCLHPATWATDLVPNPKGRPSYELRPHFAKLWVYVPGVDLWVCSEMPDKIYNEAIFDKVVSRVSHSTNTGKMLLKQYNGRGDSFCYRPDQKGFLVSDGEKTSVNLHTPPRIKPLDGDPKPFLDFMEYLFPVEKERYEVLRWCATLIARPEMRMSYGLLLASEAQGVGKTTLGSNILAKLVGEHNVSYPTEHMIVDSGFNGWAARKRLVVVNEIYSGHSWKAYHKLKTIITDRDLRVNEKYQREYNIENWSHIIAMSNSMIALKVEQDDRRWLYPEITEERWPNEKFSKLHNWLRSGGLRIVLKWAREFGDYVTQPERAPMTHRKGVLIEDSRSEPQREVRALADRIFQLDQPVVLHMKDINMWARDQVQGKVYDSDHVLRKAMEGRGIRKITHPFSIGGRRQYAVANSSAHLALSKHLQEDGHLDEEGRKLAREMLKKPGELMEAEF